MVELTKQFKALQENMNEEAVHDKRIILRRLEAMARILEDNGLLKMENGFRKYEKIFSQYGKLRDIQIIIEIINSINSETKELVEYRNKLIDKEKKWFEKLFELEHKVKTRKMGKIEKKGEEITKSHILFSLKKHFKKITKKIEKLTNDMESIHDLRIEFKILRYISEIANKNGLIPESYVSELKVYQDIMGKIHDIDQFLVDITKFLKKRKILEVAEISDENNKRIELLIQEREKMNELVDKIMIAAESCIL